jgi:hypothetical protein
MTLLASSVPDYDAVKLLILAVIAILISHRQRPDVMRRLGDSIRKGPPAIP